MIGYVDFAQPDLVSGWAFDPSYPDATVVLEILVDDGVVGRTAANRLRPDVKSAGFGDGRVGFMFEFARKLSPQRRHTVSVRVAGTHELLSNSPQTLDPVYPITDATVAGFEQAVRATASEPEAEDIQRALVAACEHLRGMRNARHQPGSRLRASGLPLALILVSALPEPGDIASRHAASLVELGFRVVVAVIDLDRDTRCDALDMKLVELAQPSEFPSIEDILQHFANEIAIVQVHGREAMHRYGALLRAHAGAARLIYNASDATISLDAIVATRWANVVFLPDADSATALRDAVPGADIRVLPHDAAADEVKKVLGRVTGSSKAPRVVPRAAA